MLMATVDTNFQVQKVLTLISPTVAVHQAPSGINNCPHPTRVFHGRRAILDKMHQYFSQNVGKQNIFLLHGLGGAGKTQIALKFIHESATHFTNIFLIDTSTTETIDAGLKDIATKISIGDSSKDALQWLQRKEEAWLLFFDNADDPNINLNNYFPQCSHGNILITSRNPGLCVYSGGHCVVSDMEGSEAVDLLLRSAVQENTGDKKDIAAQIVKLLHYLPLAIVQAGAFISKSGNMASYLALYTHNRARLLTQRPTQSHDNYAWTVYTTWQISFDMLSEQAKTFLKLCSFLHYQGIIEDIFKNATMYSLEPSGPSKEELEMPLQLLSKLLGPSGAWDPLCFLDITNELRAYSLINFDSQKNMLSIHPLVHEWIRSTLSDAASYHHCVSAIVGMSLAALSDRDINVASQWMLPHIDFLMKSSNVPPDFTHQYGKVYLFAGKAEKAKEFQMMVVEKRQNHLGKDHPDTLDAMYWLAWAYEYLGLWKEAEEVMVVVLEKRRHILGVDHPDTLNAMRNLGVTYEKLGKFREAEKFATALLQKRRSLLGDNHPDTLNVMGNLACLYQRLGRFREAEELGVHVLMKRREILSDDHPETLNTQHNVGSTYHIQGQLNKAEELEIVVVEKRQKTLGECHPDTLQSMANLSVTYHKLGKFVKAEVLALTVLAKRRDIL
ncbi:P-loop containing nucleoside triphosphate hydrolase protein, partial [Mycena latifolia]